MIDGAGKGTLMGKIEQPQDVPEVGRSFVTRSHLWRVLMIGNRAFLYAMRDRYTTGQQSETILCRTYHKLMWDTVVTTDGGMTLV